MKTFGWTKIPEKGLAESFCLFSQIQTIVLVLCAMAIVVHIIAIGFPFSQLDVRLQIIYVRNIFLSAAMTFAFVQFLEFLR